MNLANGAQRRAIFAAEGGAKKPLQPTAAAFQKDAAPPFRPTQALSALTSPSAAPRRSLTVLGGQFRRVK